VFTSTGGHVKPKKGSAAFWYNLYASGEGKNSLLFVLFINCSLFRRLYNSTCWYVLFICFYFFSSFAFFFLACPVLIGNKWVGNKWIHERGQEFRRRCSLDPME